VDRLREYRAVLVRGRRLSVYLLILPCFERYVVDQKGGVGLIAVPLHFWTECEIDFIAQVPDYGDVQSFGLALAALFPTPLAAGECRMHGSPRGVPR
jgi:hypothetical protein